MITPEVFLIAFLGIIVLLFYIRMRRLMEQLTDLQSKKQSLSTKYGNLTEQWMPFLANYEYDPQGFRFLGKPLDGIQFNDDSIVFVEFKVNTSQLTERQRNIRDLVKEGKVYFKEFRLG